jgi:hypothetical protein
VRKVKGVLTTVVENKATGELGLLTHQVGLVVRCAMQAKPTDDQAGRASLNSVIVVKRSKIDHNIGSMLAPESFTQMRAAVPYQELISDSIAHRYWRDRGRTSSCRSTARRSRGTEPSTKLRSVFMACTLLLSLH